MKAVATILTLVMILVNPMRVGATPPEFSGGVNNEYEYEEVVFLTGEPIRFSGTMNRTERDRGDTKTINYQFRLEPQNGNTGRIDRRIAYEIQYNQRDDKGQTIAQTRVVSYRETIDINGDRFVLQDYQFSKSDVIDNRPASDFSSGNLEARKYYQINGNQGRVIVTMSGGTVGYENFWGTTETQIIDYFLDMERPLNIEGEQETIAWQASVRAQVSDSMTKHLRYGGNEANLSSFEGGHMRITNQEMVSRYEYNLPQIDEDGIPHSSRRQRGTIQLSKEMSPQIERLIVPKFRDIGGHWAEEEIQKLYSLDVFDDAAQFFVPDIAMTRLEFTKAVMRGANIRLNQEEEVRRPIRNAPPEISPFLDVDVNEEDYRYIKDAVEKGVITGVSGDLFEPDSPLTRAQAITILIRVLGFENRAPNPGYYTSFSDDRNIPSWAKDSIYVAREIGLVYGDHGNRINPNQVMTRAEASAMLVRFLEFLEGDLQRDYRENIILFN